MQIWIDIREVRFCNLNNKPFPSFSLNFIIVCLSVTVQILKLVRSKTKSFKSVAFILQLFAILILLFRVCIYIYINNIYI